MRTASILRKATFGAVLVAAAIFATLPVRGADKRIVLIAGRPSHPPGMHEFRAGSLLLQKALSGVPGIKVDVYDMGWPAKMVDGARVDDSSLLDTADAVLIYADGGKGHPAIQGERMKVIDALAARGAGLGFAHYAVDVAPGVPGDAFQRWLGGLLRDELVRQSDVEARLPEVPDPSRSRAASGRSRRTTSGTSTCAGRRTRR